MAITIHWDNTEKNIIRWDFEGRWTAPQFQQSLRAAQTLASGVHHTVYGLGIISGMSSADMLSLGRHVANQWPPNMAILVFVGASGLMESAFSILGKFYKDTPRIIFADTLDQAYEVITQDHLKEVYAKS